MLVSRTTDSIAEDVDGADRCSKRFAAEVTGPDDDGRRQDVRARFPKLASSRARFLTRATTFPRPGLPRPPAWRYRTIQSGYPAPGPVSTGEMRAIVQRVSSASVTGE